MKIIYVHHGNRDGANDDLSELGVKDCELVAELLNNDKIKNNVKAIYTSQTVRCKKTAKIINKHLQLPIIEDVRLNEFKTIKNETWVDLQERMESCIDDIVARYNQNDIVICVTSGVNIVGFINKAYHLPSSENAPFLAVPSCSPIMFEYK